MSQIKNELAVFLENFTFPMNSFGYNKPPLNFDDYFTPMTKIIETVLQSKLSKQQKTILKNAISDSYNAYFDYITPEAKKTAAHKEFKKGVKHLRNSLTIFLNSEANSDEFNDTLFQLNLGYNFDILEIELWLEKLQTISDHFEKKLRKLEQKKNQKLLFYSI